MPTAKMFETSNTEDKDVFFDALENQDPKEISSDILENKVSQEVFKPDKEKQKKSVTYVVLGLAEKIVDHISEKLHYLSSPFFKLGRSLMSLFFSKRKMSEDKKDFNETSELQCQMPEDGKDFNERNKLEYQFKPGYHSIARASSSHPVTYDVSYYVSRDGEHFEDRQDQNSTSCSL